LGFIIWVHVQINTLKRYFYNFNYLINCFYLNLYVYHES
jgi:hypothetical protein